MRDAINKLIEFHRSVGQSVGDASSPFIRDINLRMRLIREEVAELNDALSAGDMVEVTDALADICYVVIGSAVTWGIPLAEAFDEVHTSNMTKVGSGQREDGKILKGPNYRPPDIKRVLADARRK